MSAFAVHPMTNHHGFIETVADVVRTWRRRAAERAELAIWTDRDLNDVGLSRDDVMLEVEKPFWRS